jgi:hypothetical protein
MVLEIPGSVRPLMAHVIYKCPRTAMRVQTWVAEEVTPSAANTFELVRCPACTQVHFVNRVDGKLLGDKRE